MAEFWKAASKDAGGPLTLELLEDAFRKLKERSDWELRHPHGVSSENPHIVHPDARKRIVREGGWAFCGTCGPFWTEPPHA